MDWKAVFCYRHHTRGKFGLFHAFVSRASSNLKHDIFRLNARVVKRMRGCVIIVYYIHLNLRKPFKSNLEIDQRE